MNQLLQETSTPSKNEVIFYEVVLKSCTFLTNIPNYYSLRHDLRLHNEANTTNNCDRLKREQQQVELCPLSLQTGWESTDYFISVGGKRSELQIGTAFNTVFPLQWRMKNNPKPRINLPPQFLLLFTPGLTLITQWHNIKDSIHISMP